MTATTVEVDVEDVPSAEWGWSRENHKLIHIGRLQSGVFLLLMMRGNHVGYVDHDVLIAFAVFVIVVGRDWYLRRHSQIR